MIKKKPSHSSFRYLVLFKNPFLRLIVTKRKNIIDPDLFSKFVLICCTDLGYSPFTMQPNIRHSGNNIHRYGAFMFKS